jgi:hypothetical protein
MKAARESEMVKIARRWMDVTDVRIEKVLKSFVATLHNWSTRQELPPWPTSQVPVRRFLPGRVGRFVWQVVNSLRLKSGRNAAARARALRTAQTLLFLKKGSPAPPPSMVRETALQHRNKLGAGGGDRTTPFLRNPYFPKGVTLLDGSTHQERYVLPEDGRDGVKSFDEMLVRESVRQIIAEVFPKGFLRVLDRETHPNGFPSVNGHFGVGREQGGAALGIGINFAKAVRQARLLEPESLDRMSYHPHLGVVAGYRSPMLDTVMALRVLKGLAKESDFACMASFVLEPLKVRAVTAGPQVAYWLLRAVQRKCWSLMRRHPTFRLIGEPVTEQALNERFESFAMESGKHFQSGDYKEATDGMRRYFSNVTWKLLAKRGDLPQWLTRLGRKALTGHEIHYLRKDLDAPPLRQRNGQLMGSILSFIVLCLVNAAVCFTAFSADWDCPYRTLAQSPLYINGDDCVMWYSDAQESRWKELSALVGMEPSIGKCYASPDWLQINSAAYFFRPGLGFTACPYVNFGLLVPEKIRGMSRRSPLELQSLASEFLKGHHPSTHHRLMSLFIREHRKEGGLLRMVPNGCSWWLPSHLGGLGLPFIPSEEEERELYNSVEGEDLPPVYSEENPLTKRIAQEISGRQRIMATTVMNSFTAGAKPVRPFPGADSGLPNWLAPGLRRDLPLSVGMSRREFLSTLSEEEREKLAQPYARAEHEIGPYSSALWEQALDLPEDPEELLSDPRVFPADRLSEQERFRVQMRSLWRSWKRVWDKPGSPAPASVLLSHEPHVHFFPGGLSDVLSSVRTQPRGLISRLSALQGVFHREHSRMLMKGL